MPLRKFLYTVTSACFYFLIEDWIIDEGIGSVDILIFFKNIIFYDKFMLSRTELLMIYIKIFLGLFFFCLFVLKSLNSMNKEIPLSPIF